MGSPTRRRATTSSSTARGNTKSSSSTVRNMTSQPGSPLLTTMESYTHFPRFGISEGTLSLVSPACSSSPSSSSSSSSPTTTTNSSPATSYCSSYYSYPPSDLISSRVPGQLNNVHLPHDHPNPVYFSSLERRFAAEAIDDNGCAVRLLTGPDMLSLSPETIYPGGDPLKNTTTRLRTSDSDSPPSAIRSPSPRVLAADDDSLAKPSSSPTSPASLNLYMAPYTRSASYPLDLAPRNHHHHTTNPPPPPPPASSTPTTPPQPPRSGAHIFCKHAWQASCRCHAALKPDGEGDHCDRCWAGACAGPAPPGSRPTTAESCV